MSQITIKNNLMNVLGMKSSCHIMQQMVLLGWTCVHVLMNHLIFNQGRPI